MHVELTEEEKIKVMNSDEVYQVMRRILLREKMIDHSQEHFWVVCLAASNKILNIELVSLGSLNMVIVKPMQVFRFGLMKGAVRVVLVHNHPSENLTPTEPDLDITDRMIQVGRIVEVEVVDHLIISPDGFFSFQRSGLLDKLKLSKKWVPRFQEEDRIRKEALKLGEKRGKKEGRKEGKRVGIEAGIKKVAKKMIKDGEPIKKITKYTGLSKEEIENL